MSRRNAHGKLVVLSGPSGAGKSTVLDALADRFGGNLRLAVSATTRPPRPAEIDGKDYHFLSRDEFDRRRTAGEFLECFEVFGRGHWYGTLTSEVNPFLDAGRWVILEIDVDGAREVLRKHPDATTIFLRPSSTEEIERRLRSRGTENEEAVARRLSVARRELALASTYDYTVINDQVAEAVAEVVSILINRGLAP